MAHLMANPCRFSRARQAALLPLVRNSSWSPSCLWILIPLASWTRAQVQARAHPNVLKVWTWINNLYREKMEGIDLDVPLVYADSFHIRRPGVQWNVHPPHVNGVSAFPAKIGF